jgi:hypothetical protein
MQDAPDFESCVWRRADTIGLEHPVSLDPSSLGVRLSEEIMGLFVGPGAQPVLVSTVLSAVTPDDTFPVSSSSDSSSTTIQVSSSLNATYTGLKSENVTSSQQGLAPSSELVISISTTTSSKNGSTESEQFITTTTLIDSSASSISSASASVSSASSREIPTVSSTATQSSQSSQQTDKSSTTQRPSTTVPAVNSALASSTLTATSNSVMSASVQSPLHPGSPSNTSSHSPGFIVGIILGTLLALSILVASIIWAMRTRRRSDDHDGLSSDFDYKRHEMFSPKSFQVNASSDHFNTEKGGDGSVGLLPTSRSDLGMRSSTSLDFSRFPPLPHPTVNLPPIAFNPHDRRFGTLRIANLVPGDISDSDSVNNAGVGSGARSASNSSISTLTRTEAERNGLDTNVISER